MGVRPSVTSSQRTTTQASITFSSFIFLTETSPANGLPWWLSGKESACQAGASGWSCLGKPGLAFIKLVFWKELEKETN